MSAASVHETAPQAGFPSSSFKYTPLRHVRVLFVSFIQGLFKAAPAGCYHWDSDADQSEIFITNENTINVDKIGSRPAISCTRGSVKFYSLGMDDMEFFDFRTEKKTKNVLVPGTMSINCCSRNDIESDDIAWVVAEHIWLLRDLLLKEGFFEIGRQPVIGSPSQAGNVVTNDEGQEWYCTPVTIPFQFYRQSQFTPLGRRIARSIELNLQTNSQKRVGTGGPAQAGHEYPLNVRRCFPQSFAPDASDARGGTPDPAGTSNVFPLPKVPHPLNPSAVVTVRSVRPNKPGIRPPGMGGVVLPIRDPCEGESEL